jgi:putative Ca2+/H+ antiporter (TMEM165/GDT1 family)
LFETQSGGIEPVHDLPLHSLKEERIMDLKLLVATFVTIFLAELGDKTQLATLAFSAEGKSPVAVFIGSAAALVITSLLSVVFGAAIAKLIPFNYVKIGAGALFVLLGLWMLIFPGGK